MLGLENPLHILIVLLVVLVVFGAKRLPELGRSLGSGMREFKDSISGDGADRTRGQEQTTALEPTSEREASTAPPPR